MISRNITKHITLTELSRVSYLHRTWVQRAVVHHHLRQEIQLKRSHDGKLCLFSSSLTQQKETDDRERDQRVVAVVVNSRASMVSPWRLVLQRQPTAKVREKPRAVTKSIHVENPSTGATNTTNRMRLRKTPLSEMEEEHKWQTQSDGPSGWLSRFCDWD